MMNTTEYYWDWWHSLDDMWKRIFNYKLGKPKAEEYVYIAPCVDINEVGITDTPSLDELEQIIALKEFKYSTWRHAACSFKRH